ncbi:MAG: aldo/keto reductase [Halobacteriales archaeon]|nr:aldo/keto reductase [Halobacteriales archaeon]
MSVDALPPLGLGTYENKAFEQCAESVRTALEAGYRHIDTAQSYENEDAVGEGLRRASVDRDEVFLATKLSTRNLAREDVLETARESAARLGVETIDLLYVHWPIRSYEPTETLPALDQLRDEGLIRHVGLSNFEPDQLDEALDLLEAPLFAHQVEHHPLLPQERLREYAVEDDHWLVAYSPVAKGEVADVPELVEIAAAHDATPFQVALAWLLQEDHVAAIPKATGEAHIRENYGALELELTDEAVARIDAIGEERRLVDFEEAPWNRREP